MIKIQETTWLQLESVLKVAKSLRYEFDGRSFYTYLYEGGRYRMFYVSFDNMQKIHNTGCYYKTSRGVLSAREDFKHKFCKLKRSLKIVEKSTLQWHKRGRKFLAQKNIVKFV